MPATSPPTLPADDDEDRPLRQQQQHRWPHPLPSSSKTSLWIRQASARSLKAAAAVAAVALLIAALAASSRAIAASPPPPTPAELLATVNQPYYQARLRPLALSLGDAHPIVARRPPHASFADVRLTPPGSSASSPSSSDRAGRLAALLAASDGGDAGGVPSDAASYEIFAAVTDEWWEEVDAEAEAGEEGQPAPAARRRVKRTRERRQLLTCLDAAKRLLPEPFHPSMLVRNRTVPTSWAAPAAAGRGEPPWRQPPHPHATELSPSLWRWDEGAISREAFDAVPAFLGGPACPLCFDVLRYRTFGGRLYRAGRDCKRDLFNASAPPLAPGKTRCPDDWPRGRVLEEILLVAAYLYRLPDADLAVHRGDGASAEGHPLLQHNIQRDHPLGGWTLPYPGPWEQVAPSARQAAAWAACTRARYGTVASEDRRGRRRGGGKAAAAAAGEGKEEEQEGAAASSSSSSSSSPSSSCARAPLLPRAVWRGTTTDPKHGAWLHQLLGMARARLHVLSLVHRDALDARLVAVKQLDQTEEMRRDKAADERLLGIPSSFGAGEGEEEAVAWGLGGEAAAKRAAEAGLADCRRKGKSEAGDGEGDGNDDGDDGDDGGGPRPPVYIPMEDFNRYTAVVDVDGNGWSARLLELLSGASARPVLKQATPLAAAYEHLFAPGRHLAHFRGDLRDVDDVARRWAGLARAGWGAEGGGKEDDDEDEDEGALPAGPAAADAMAAEAAALAALTLNRWAIVESAAASIEAYAERADWAPDPPRPEDGWEAVPFSSCCVYGGLPAELLAAMRAEADD